MESFVPHVYQQSPVIATSSRFPSFYTGQHVCQSEYRGVSDVCRIYERVISYEVRCLIWVVHSREEAGNASRSNQHIVNGHMPQLPVVNCTRLVYYRLRIHFFVASTAPHRRYLFYIEFFASRRADITSMRSVLPVNFWISGSYNSKVSSANVDQHSDA